jgi:hypothetical protein
MTFRGHLGRIAAPLALVGLLSSCGGVAVATPTTTTTTTATPAATPAPTPTATTTRKAKATTLAATAAAGSSGLTAIARRQYSAEIHGGAAFAALHRVARDQTLLRTLQSGSVSATRAYVQRTYSAVWYHWHVARMRILQGSRVVVETGVPFAVAPVHMTLRGAGGRALGTLQVSIQDVIGFVRLIHRHYPVNVVVHGQSGQVRSSLPAATRVKLPSAGTVTIAGRPYRVSSFRQTAWGNEPVTVSILQRA